MPRLIDADELRKDVLNLPDCPNGFSDTYDKSLIIALVDEAPTIDAVPVIRCKDCKFWNTNSGKFKDKYGVEWSRCKRLHIGTDERFFCREAERKDDE